MREGVQRLHGLFVGQLEDDELAAFDRACSEGWARRVYRGEAGFIGLAKVEVDLPTPSREDGARDGEKP